MNTCATLAKILKIGRLCARHRDLLAGTCEERKFIHELLRELDNPLLTFHLHPLTVVTWRENYAYIELENESFPALLLPYSKGGVAEGKIVTKIEETSPDSILVTYFPEDVDDAKFITVQALSRGVAGIVFIDRENTFRRIVVSKRRDYTRNSDSTINIPIVSVSRPVGETLLKNAGKRIRIVAEARYEYSIGYNVEVIVREGEEYILITSHFDHWLYCLLDNSLGVGLAAAAIDYLMLEDTNTRMGVKVLFFTAEEFGIPNFASLYWTWGSYTYVKYLNSRHMLNDIKFVINVDVIGKEPRIYTTEDSMTYLSDICNLYDVEFRHTIPYFDSLNFELEGVPTITISCLEKVWNIYHSFKESEEAVDQEAVAKSFNILTYSLRKVLREEFPYEIYIDSVRRILEKHGIYIRKQRDYETYRLLRKVLSKHVVEYCKDEVNLRFVENLVQYMYSLPYREKLLEVQELGSGTTLFVRSSPEDMRGSIMYLLEELRYSLYR